MTAAVERIVVQATPQDKQAIVAKAKKLEDKVNRQVEAMKSQQAKIEELTGRVIRLEAQLELITGAALVKQRKGD